MEGGRACERMWSLSCSLVVREEEGEEEKIHMRELVKDMSV